MTKTDDKPPLEKVARAWLTKMRGADANAVREEFDAWYASSDEHREAYARIQRQFAASSILKSSARHGSIHSGKRGRKPLVWIGWSAATAVAALMIITIGTGGMSVPGMRDISSPIARAAEPLVTRRGEIRTFRLHDGSTVTLDTDSRANVVLGNRERRLQLTKGRARLSIARQDYPMRVEAGATVLTTHDALIDLRLDQVGDVSIALRRGAVSADADAGEISQLPPDQTFLFRRNGQEPLPVDASALIPREWTDGWAEYRSVRLDQLVAEANRYAARPIIMDGRDLHRLEISGRFRITQTEVLAARIARLFDLEVDGRSDAIHLRRR